MERNQQGFASLDLNGCLFYAMEAPHEGLVTALLIFPGAIHISLMSNFLAISGSGLNFGVLPLAYVTAFNEKTIHDHSKAWAGKYRDLLPV